MFEIRIVCGADDIDRVTTALSAAFVTGTSRKYPSRDGLRTLLYFHADLLCVCDAADEAPCPRHPDSTH
ncbi:hypothetical protein ABZX85_35955 [Streptomyces sp. NPDC004539]|uniref:hypothetical protein n=1 Tax=Streptomyces sp. NPDC004539 TaxID=3154280 RepID=UPI0033A5DC8E